MARIRKITAKAVTRDEYREELQLYCHSLFLLPGFVESIVTTSSATRYYHFLNDGHVVGKIAGIEEQEYKLMGKYLLFYAGPALIRKDETLYNDCLDALKRCAKKQKFTRITVFYYDQQYQFRCNTKGFYMRTNREFIRHFNNNGEPLEFSKSLVFNVKKASKLSPVFKQENSPGILTKLHDLLQETHKLRNDKFHGAYLPYPYKHLNREAVNRMFDAGLIKLYHVEVKGVVHCVRCAISNGKRMYGLLVAGDEFAYKNGLQHFLQHNLITLLHEQGYLYYNVSVVDFGEDGLVNYKESLGCRMSKVHGAYTHFIRFPQSLMNPLMAVGRFLGKNNFLNNIVKMGSRLVVGKNL